jgi:hypothetical protein
VVKNPSPDKKSSSANTGFFLVTITFECFIFSLYVIKYNKIKRNKNNHSIYASASIQQMNSYGSVSRVSESIYKLLRYMNWISSNDDSSNDNKTGSNDHNDDNT